MVSWMRSVLEVLIVSDKVILGCLMPKKKLRSLMLVTGNRLGKTGFTPTTSLPLFDFAMSNEEDMFDLLKSSFALEQVPLLLCAPE